jgi:ribulose kinase
MLKSSQEQSTADIWFAICYCSRLVLQKSGVDPELVKGIGFDATCSLAVMSEDTNEPISVAGPDFTETARNVICMLRYSFYRLDHD